MIHFEPIDIRYVFSSDFSFTSILSRFQDELDEYSTNLLPHLEKSSVSTKKQMKSSVQNSLSDDFQWLFKILGNFGFFHRTTVF